MERGNENSAVKRQTTHALLSAQVDCPVDSKWCVSQGHGGGPQVRAPASGYSSKSIKCVSFV